MQTQKRGDKTYHPLPVLLDLLHPHHSRHPPVVDTKVRGDHLNGLVVHGHPLVDQIARRFGQHRLGLEVLVGGKRSVVAVVTTYVVL